MIYYEIVIVKFHRVLLLLSYNLLCGCMICVLYMDILIMRTTSICTTWYSNCIEVECHLILNMCFYLFLERTLCHVESMVEN